MRISVILYIIGPWHCLFLHFTWFIVTSCFISRFPSHTNKKMIIFICYLANCVSFCGKVNVHNSHFKNCDLLFSYVESSYFDPKYFIRYGACTHVCLPIYICVCICVSIYLYMCLHDCLCCHVCPVSSLSFQS